jgi:hypothetical protein
VIFLQKVADAFSRLCVLNGGTGTRKVSGQKRTQDTPAGEEGSRRSLRLGLKKQAREIALSEQEDAEATSGEIDTPVNPFAPQTTSGEIDTPVNPFAPQTKGEGTRAKHHSPKSIDLPRDKILDSKSTHKEGVGLNKVPDEMMQVSSIIASRKLKKLFLAQPITRKKNYSWAFACASQLSPQTQTRPAPN